MSFAITVARNTSWSEPAGSPWSRRTRIAYNELEHDVSSELTWSVAVSLSLSTTPSAVMLRTDILPHTVLELSLFFKFWTLCIFEPPFGGLGTSYDVHLGLIGKRVVVFLLVLIEFFRKVLRLRCYGQK